MHLADDEFAVAEDPEPLAAVLLGQFQGVHQRGVLGNVVGRFAQGAGLFDVGLAGPLQNDSPRRRARIAAGAAVRVDDEFAFVLHGGIL